MVLYGADTEQLRQQRHACTGATRRLAALCEGLQATVASTTWWGTDADAFRARWEGSRSNLVDACELLHARSEDLLRHADQQDRASASDRMADDGHGAEGLGSLGAGSVSDELGRGGPGGQRMVPGGFDPDLQGMGPNDKNTIPDKRGFTPHLNPGDDDDWGFENSPEDGAEVKHTVDLGAVKVEVTDEWKALTLEASYKSEYPYELGPATVTVEREISGEFQLKKNADGTWTYVFTEKIRARDEAEIGGKRGGASAHHESSWEQKYEVTVPAGTSPLDAMRIDPRRPEKIPPGAEITISHTVENRVGGEAKVAYQGLELAAIGGERVMGKDITTVIGRDESGNLSIRTGPTAELGADSTLRFGTEDVHLKNTIESRDKRSTISHTEFDASPEGEAAYLKALRTGQMPAHAESPGVSDRYNEIRTSSGADAELALKLGAYEASRKNHAGGDELIVREYPKPDGSTHTEWAQQILTLNRKPGERGLITGGDGRETTYRMELGPNGDTTMSDSRYGGPGNPDGSATLVFSHEEMSRMQEGGDQRRGNSPYGTPANYFSALLARTSGSQSDGVQTMFSDYNKLNHGGVPQPENGDHKMPGRRLL